MKKSKKTYIIIIVILIGLLIGLGGYTVYNNYIKKEAQVEVEFFEVEKVFESKKLELTDPLVTSLVYPKVNGFGDSGAAVARYIYKTITLDTYGRDMMMITSTQGLEKEEIGDSAGYRYNAVSIKNNFMKIFGPDTVYEDGDLEGDYCCQIQTYNQINNTYTSNCRCGGFGPDFDNYTKLYKAVQNEDSIETYFYVKPYVKWDGENKVYLYDRELKNNEFTEDTLEAGPEGYKIINYNKIVSSLDEVDKMMDNGEVDTYVFTFKKQVDGNYYFYSGNWIN